MVIINKHVELKVPAQPDPLALVNALYECFKLKGTVVFKGSKVSYVNNIIISVDGYASIELCSDDWGNGFTLVMKKQKFFIKRKRLKV
ncbi:hypothetical protein [Putridiphycobacter roseus]|nr:hypothetical protein [Putridiphycobacter roseus]